MASVYSSEEVAKHSTKNDLWLVVHNKVYNVTEFVQEVKFIHLYLTTSYQRI